MILMSNLVVIFGDIAVIDADADDEEHLHLLLDRLHGVDKDNEEVEEE